MFIRSLSTDFFSAPNLIRLKEKLDHQLKEQNKKTIHKIQTKNSEKTDVSSPPAEVSTASIIDTTGKKKQLGDNPTLKLQDLIIDRLSGETQPVPINNLLQSVSQEYDI